MPVQRKTFTRSGNKFEKREEDFYRQEVEDSINDLTEELKRIASSSDSRTSLMLKRTAYSMGAYRHIRVGGF